MKIFTKFAQMLLLFFTLASASFAQNYTVSGVVTSDASGEKLIGANIFILGTSLGAATDLDGNYSISVPEGTYTIVCSYIGFERIEKSIDVNQNLTVNFSLKDYFFTLNVEVIADRARERETPVAFTNIKKREIEAQLGSRDIPLILNTAPSVFSTVDGGGAGDARINVRGFDQRNVAIMINGVPINDMENGWVYWSNWDGLGDATSSIQLQRGLSAVNLAAPSIGGTINVITDPTKQKAGLMFKNEIGSGNFSKQTLFVNSGLINNKFAFSIGGVRKLGDGVVDKAWTDAWAYYFGASYQLNDKNRFEVYALGAPQRHGQRVYRLNAAAFSHELARELGYSETALNDSKLAEQGIYYNPNWNSVSSSYAGDQFFNGGREPRYSANYLMERENYFHKPIVNLNWYSQLSERLSLYTTFYWSGGTGGGTGTLGSIQFNTSLLQRVPDWDLTIAANRANIDTLPNGIIAPVSRGIIRNSVNNQSSFGAIAKSYYKFSDNFKGSFGIDWRTATVDHFREVRDLLGGDYVFFDGNEFNTSPIQNYARLGDKIDYNFTNTVDWLGAYLQGEATINKWSFYGLGGYTIIKYTYTNHFKKDASGNEIFSETDNIGGYQVKGGADYRITDNIDIYGNLGYVSKVPIFDQVINDRAGVKAEDPKNEKFASFELGSNFRLLENKLNLKVNLYYTSWKDRAQSISVVNADGSDGLVFLNGVSSLHSGIEFEGSYQPARWIIFNAAASFGNWKYTEDVQGTYIIDYSTNTTVDYTYYIKDLKVGDAPQTQITAGVTFIPIKGLSTQINWRNYSSYFSQFDPFSRNDPADRGQSWEIPSYNLVDLHFNYDLPLELSNFNVSVFAHIFNLFNELYVQDATDNSSFNSYKANGVNHSADDAEVFLGLERNFNLGIRVAY